MIPLIIDSFAGGGGASTGIEMALGRSPDIAINHNAVALAMHAANHPATLHLSKNIWQVDPLEAVRNRPVGLAWFSPDCKDFSKAKGGVPVRKNIRDLAWVVVLWAKRARPAVIMVENVEEFRGWGPLIRNAKGELTPCPDRRGDTFRRWMAELKRLGYKIEWKELVGADYGAPTTRKRLFIIMRRDGQPIVWPAPTHGKASDPEVIAGRRLRWFSSGEDVIDWSIPCPSIFDTSAEIKAKFGIRAIRPLAPNTIERVRRGTQRYVIDTGDPFIVKFRSGATGHSIRDPLCTVTANSFVKRPGGSAPIGLVMPHLIPITHTGDHRTYDPREQLRTITTANGGEMAVVAANLISVAHGDSGGRREYGADEPTGTIAAGGNHQAVVAAFLVQHNNDSRRIGGVNPGLPADRPLSTITVSGSQQGVAAVQLINMKGAPTRGLHSAADPVPTICASTTHAYAAAAFLTKYYGEGGVDQDLGDPLHTITTKARLGLVTVHVEGEPYFISDIGLRMLTPRELFRAQGFPDTYRIDIKHDGRKLTKAEQIACCGNSVCPPLAAALVAANAGHLAVRPVVAEAAE